MDGEHGTGGKRTERPVLVQGAGRGALVGVDKAVIWPLVSREHACALEPIQQGAQEARERLRSVRWCDHAARWLHVRT